MIRTSGKSEVFDNYSKNMQAYLDKRAGMLSVFVDALKAGTKTVDDIPAGTTMHQVAKAMLEQGIGASEVSAKTGLPTKEVMKLSDDAAEIISKTSPELAQAVEDSAKIIKQEAKSVIKNINIIKSLQDAGKSPEEIAKELGRLKRSRTGLKSALTRTKNQLSQSKELAAKYQDELAQSTGLYNQTAKHVAAIEEQLLKSTKELAEAGQQVTKLTGELSTANKTIKELEAQNLKLSEEGKKLLAVCYEEAKAHQFKKDLSKVERATHGDSSTAHILDALAEESAKRSKIARNKVIRENPQAAASVRKGLQESAEEGSEDASRVAQEAKTHSAKPGKDGKLEKSFVKKLVMNYAGGATRGAGAAAKALAVGGAAVIGGGLSLAGTGLSYLGILAMLGGGGALIWRYFLRSNPLIARQHVDGISKAQLSAIERLRALRFAEASDGQRVTNELIEKIQKSNESIKFLLKDEEQITQKEFNMILTDLGNLEEPLMNYFTIQRNKLEADLTDKAGWPEALGAVQALQGQMIAFKAILMRAYDEHGTFEGRDEQAQRELSGRESEGSEEGGTSPHQQPKATIREPLTIFGKEFETAHLQPGMKDSLSGLMSSVLATPQGLAYLDPKGGRGPHGRSYLEAMKYLYLSGVGSPREIVRLVDKTYGRKTKDKRLRRKKDSEFHQRVSYYRQHLSKYRRSLRESARKYFNRELKSVNSEKFTQKFIKPANSKTSSVIYDDNGIDFSMNKKADTFSKEYFQDATSGLEDQYAKSYYAGLKSMYDQKLGRTEADFQKLYNVHNESGADLIGKAHPKSIDVADAMGRGGLVENQIEQQRHNKGVAQSMPTGNFLGRHASVIENLVKLADQADEQGMKEASDLIDAALEELTSI